MGCRLLASVVFLLATLPPGAEGSRLRSASALNKVSSARSMGMGGATAAIGGDADLLWLNPAAAAGMRNSRLTVGAQSGFFGETVGHMISAFRVEDIVITACAAYYDTGQVTLNSPGGLSWRVTAQRDLMASVGLASSFFPGSTMGFSVKYLRTELAEAFVTTALVADVGFQFRLHDLLKIGASVLNSGNDYSYKEDRCNLPTSFVGGIAGAFRPNCLLDTIPPGDLVVMAEDLEFGAGGDFTSAKTGIEYQARETLILRTGFRRSPNVMLQTVTAGVGLNFALPQYARGMHFRIDYSTEFGGANFSRPQVFSLSIDFPGISPAAPAAREDAKGEIPEEEEATPPAEPEASSPGTPAPPDATGGIPPPATPQ